EDRAVPALDREQTAAALGQVRQVGPHLQRLLPDLLRQGAGLQVGLAAIEPQPAVPHRGAADRRRVERARLVSGIDLEGPPRQRARPFAPATGAASGLAARAFDLGELSLERVGAPGEPGPRLLSGAGLLGRED